MAIDRKIVEEILAKLGTELKSPATPCIFGSTPAILLGQPSRQTQDIDVWYPASDFDAGEVA